MTTSAQIHRPDASQAASGFSLRGAALRVRDAERVSGFYETALGLDRLEQSAEGVTLGFGGKPLLTLVASPNAPARRPRSAGLFHLAFLVSERADLSRVLHRLAAAEIPLSGASDHGVSEALYLDDPEGNGVEIYVDRPMDAWPRDREGRLAMVTEAPDIRGIVATAPGDASAPKGVTLGHVHLETGDVTRATKFYLEKLPFDLMQLYGGAAAFLGADGYHHHVGLNSWRAAGAGPVEPGALGLAEVWYGFDDGKPASFMEESFHDPWGVAWRRLDQA